MNQELEQLEELKKLMMRLVTEKKRFIKLSNKRRDMSFDNNTEKQIQNAEANLNWCAMDYDKLFREVHAVAVDCGIADPRDSYSEIDYHPSSWHTYKHQPRIPLCRQ